jgi:hypothetical protein
MAEAETGVVHPQTKDCQPPPEARTWQEHSTANLEFRPPPSRTVRMSFCCGKPPGDALLQQPQDNETATNRFLLLFSLFECSLYAKHFINCLT